MLEATKATNTTTKTRACGVQEVGGGDICEREVILNICSFDLRSSGGLCSSPRPQEIAYLTGLGHQHQEYDVSMSGCVHRERYI